MLKFSFTSLFLSILGVPVPIFGLKNFRLYADVVSSLLDVVYSKGLSCGTGVDSLALQSVIAILGFGLG